MKTMTKAAQVQRDLVKELLDASNIQVADIEVTDAQTIYASLTAIEGFNNTQHANDVALLKVRRENTQIISTLKQKLTMLARNPNFKVTTLARLLPILEKYDLYLGSVSNYIKEIPIKNAKDILEYQKIIHSRSQYCVACAGSMPLTYSIVNNSHTNGTSYFICGSLDNFADTKDRVVVEREVIYDPNMKRVFKLQNGAPDPDPIVIHPIITGNRDIDKYGLIDIVTAWDREALDPVVTNEKMN